MKRLLITILVLACSVAFASWRQQGILKLRGEISRLAAELERVHRSVRAGRGEQEDLEKHLRQMHREALAQPDDPAVAAFQEPPGPEVEGRWPESRPYFYLDKSLLRLARFEDVERTPEEVRAAGLEFESNVDYSLENRLFSEDRLNETMVKLLGMTDTERASVEAVYEQLRRQVRALEASKIEKLDPPQPAEHSRLLIARIPSLSQDLESLLENTQKSLETILGPARTELLRQQATIYFNRYCDGLGVKAREFLLNNHMLSVLYSDAYGKSAKSTSLSLGQRGPWEYSHLFDPGCE